MRHLTYLLVIILVGLIFAQKTPLQKSDYSAITSHAQISRFLEEVTSAHPWVKYETIGKSVGGRELFAVWFSKSDFAADPSKLKVLIFCQQHGNEQSGKEGALLLIQELLKPENSYLFDKIDFVLVPQVNPDGSETNSRRNKNDMDLNRNHLILSEPETIALHKLFNKYLFEVTMDVHEYFPYGDTYKEFGYRANSDIEAGRTTNINISGKIRELSKTRYLPFLKKQLNANNISYFEYSPGGPPEKEYIRHSTFDINDGRQSLGIQNTFSFIQEGLNGTDRFLDNIKHRAESQMTGMMALLQFSYDNKDELKQLIAAERSALINNTVSPKVAIQLDHFPDGTKLELPLLSYYTGRDTVITVTNYRPLVKAIHEVSRPAGYLIPSRLTEITEWADRHQIKYTPYTKQSGDKYEHYFISSIDSIDFEGDIIVNPDVKAHDLGTNLPQDTYLFIPVNQLKNNTIVIALEPKSELGLVTYPGFKHLLQKDGFYPIIRLIR